jgi:hypothetical protein
MSNRNKCNRFFALPLVVALSVQLLAAGAIAQSDDSSEPKLSAPIETKFPNSDENAGAKKGFFHKVFGSGDDKDNNKDKDKSDEDKKKSEPPKEETKSEPKESKADKKAEKAERKAAEKAEKKALKESKKTEDATAKGEKKDEPVKSGGVPIAPAASSPPTSASGEDQAHKFAADPALISVLKDLCKALKESEDIEKLQDPAQKAAMKLVGEAMDKATSDPQLSSNRIIAEADKDNLAKSMTAESWDSGDIQLPGNRHASLSVLWAKRVDGLINISVAGCGKGDSPPGQFVAIINGKSGIDSGFDIQTQSKVSFWLGKLVGFSVDANASPDNAAYRQRTQMILKSVITPRRLQYMVALKAKEEAALKEKEAEAKGGDSSTSSKTDAGALTSGTQSSAPTNSERSNESALGSENPSTVERINPDTGDIQTSTVASMETPEGMRGRWDSPSAAPSSRAPSADAMVLAPDWALAGQYVTVSVVNHSHAGEPYVELSFNGASMSTGADGKITYMVPEDALPGPSLLIAMPGHPDASPSSVNVLQPLQVPSEPQVPRIDRISAVIAGRGPVVIEGHSFEGVADHNRVIIDGMHDAQILVASPVQLKAMLPADLQPGQHNISVSANGLRSNPGQCEVVSVRIESASKDDRKLLVTVVGTESKVRLRLHNMTPNIIRIQKGNDITIVTPGGANNSTALAAQRLSPGPFHISASAEPMNQQGQTTPQ